MALQQQCPDCKDTRHIKVLDGSGKDARWVFRPCTCVLRERLRSYLGPFASAPRIATTPLLSLDTKNVFCSSSLQDVKPHIGHYLRSKGLNFTYKVLDIAALGALYISKEQEDESDRGVYERNDLILVMLNLTSIRSQKADDLLSRAIQYRSFIFKPLWIVYSSTWEAFGKEFPSSALIAESFERITLRGEQALLQPSASSPANQTKRTLYGI